MAHADSARLVTVKEAARLLGCSEANLYGLLESGKLPYVPIGRRKGYRIDVEDLHRFIEQRKILNQPQESLHRARLRLKHVKLSVNSSSKNPS